MKPCFGRNLEADTDEECKGCRQRKECLLLSCEEAMQLVKDLKGMAS